MAGELILLISAQDETAETISMTLEAGGFSVSQIPFSDVDAVLSARIAPGLIFVNPDTERTRGLEICEKIHNTPSFESVPIIVITSFGGTVEQRYVDMYGIVDFLKKPVGAAAVLEKAERIIGQLEPQAGHDKNDLAELEKSSPVTKGSSYQDEKILEMLGVKTAQEPDQALAPPIVTTADVKHKVKWPLVGMALLVIVVGVIAAYMFFAQPTPSVSHKPVPPPASVPLQEQQPASAGPGQAGSEKPPAKDLGQQVTQEKIAIPESNVSPSVQQPAGPKLPGKTTYAVQLGAFKSEASASALSGSFQKKGYETYIHKGSDSNKGVLYRVLVGKFDARRDAAALASTIQSEERTAVTIFSETPPK